MSWLEVFAAVITAYSVWLTARENIWCWPTGVVSVVLGEAVLFGSSRLLAYAGAVFTGFHLFVLLYEEPAHRRRFGAEFDEYCRRVPRWIPRLG